MIICFKRIEIPHFSPSDARTHHLTELRLIAEFLYYSSQSRLPHELSGLSRGSPNTAPLLPFRPVLLLACDLERKNVNFASDRFLLYFPELSESPDLYFTAHPLTYQPFPPVRSSRRGGLKLRRFGRARLELGYLAAARKSLPIVFCLRPRSPAYCGTRLRLKGLS
jgi:hypothetical protein